MHLLLNKISRIFSLNYTVERILPKNFKKNDLDVFKHEINRKFKSIFIIQRKNIYIKNYKFYFLNYLQFGSKFWRMGELKLMQKIKEFLKNLLLLIDRNGEEKQSVVIEEASWVINEKSHNYFHWYCDVLQRLEYLIEFNLSKNKNIKPVLLSENYLNKNYIQPVLNDFDIPHMYLDSNKIYKIKNLDITSHAAPSGNYDPRIINKISEKFKLKYLETSLSDGVKSYNRTWISRSSAGKRRIKNMDEISETLKKFKFDIVDFQDMNIKDQVNIVNNSDVLGGVHGAGLTNMLFLEKNMSVIEIRGSGDKSNNCFFSLASELSLDYYYFLANVKDNNFYSSDYYIEPESFYKFLSSIFENLND